MFVSAHDVMDEHVSRDTAFVPLARMTFQGRGLRCQALCRTFCWFVNKCYSTNFCQYGNCTFLRWRCCFFNYDRFRMFHNLGFHHVRVDETCMTGCAHAGARAPPGPPGRPGPRAHEEPCTFSFFPCVQTSRDDTEIPCTAVWLKGSSSRCARKKS